MTVWTLIIVIFTILDISNYIQKGCGYMSCLMRVYLLYPVSKWLQGNAWSVIFGKNHKHSLFNFLSTYLVYVAPYPIRLWLTGCLNTVDIHNLVAYRYLRYQQVGWSWVIFVKGMQHVLPLPSKGHISGWINNNLKFINPNEITFCAMLIALHGDNGNGSFEHVFIACLINSDYLHVISTHYIHMATV